MSMVTFVSRIVLPSEGVDTCEVSYTDDDGSVEQLGFVEGVDWVRGQHALGSEEAQALLVAWAISRHG